MRFDELVRKFKTVNGSPLTEREIRDYYYQSMSKIVPDLKTATYNDAARGAGDGYNFKEMRIYCQKFEAENKSVFQQRSRSGAMHVKSAVHPNQSDRCFNCGANGHKAYVCPQQVGSPICYNCHEPGHMGRSCPLPPNFGRVNNPRLVKRNNAFPLPNTKFFKSNSGIPKSRGRGNSNMRFRGRFMRRGTFMRPVNNENRNNNYQPNYNNMRRGRGRFSRGRSRGNRQTRLFTKNTNSVQNTKMVNGNNSKTGLIQRNTQTQDNTKQN